MNNKIILRLAAIYNLAWGAWVILFPEQFFQITGIEEINYPFIWQCLGMVVGVYGIAYWFASYDIIRYWPIIAVGLLGKILGPAGFLINYLNDNIPGKFFYTLITNDLIWWIPFTIILMNVYEKNKNRRV